MNKLYKKAKKGVALVTVLLFMLVATIAATATYKWLNSEGWSSASRMQIREAEQAAQAGLVSTRSWMSYHGNETGAIIGQYLKEHKPILLNNITGNINEKQEDSVWVTGVDVSRSPYTIKLVSKGFSRNKSATYQKAAIFSVNGLYKTKLPSQPAVMDFNDALYAGSAGGISLSISSGIVNGDVMLNTSVDVPGRLIATGNVNVNSDTHIKDLYVYGDLYSCTNLNVTGNAYVRKTLYVNGNNIFGSQAIDGTISGGNVYADQGVDMTGSGTTRAQCSTGPGTNFTIYGNLTTNGNILTPRHNAGTAYTVRGNVVVNNGGQIVFPDINGSYSYTSYGQTNTFYDSTVFDGQSYSVNFLGNIYLSGGINNNGFHAKYQFAPNFVLGSAGKQVYTGKPIYRVTSAEGLIDESTDYYNFWALNDVVTNTPHVLTYKSKYGTNVTTSAPNILAGNVFCNNPNCAPSDNNDDNFWNNAAFYEDCATHEDKCTKEGPYHCDGYLGPWNDCHGEWKRVCEEHFDLAYSCKVKRNDAFFQVNGTYTTTAPDPTEWEANKMEEVTSSIDTKAGSGCSGPHIKEPIQFNEAILENAFVFSKDNKGVCDIPFFWNDGENQNWPKLEQCYNAASRNGKLYKNEWLVIKFDGQYQFHSVTATETVSKKYIMIFENPATVSLPKTTNEGMAFIYLKQGGTLAFSQATKTQRNFFVYGDGDIFYNGGSDYPVNGTFFLKNCHAITGVNTITVNYNESLMEALSNHNIICANDDTDRCEGGSSGSASAPGSPGYDEDYDDYYVAVSPELYITIESEYKHKEKGIGANISSNVNPSYLVLPRIIYLPKNPEGSLSDYYDVVPLNGAALEKNALNVTCNTAIPVSNKFSLSTEAVASGLHKCIYDDNTYGKVPFYIIVGNDDENPTDVKFAESVIEIARGGTAVPVNITVKPDANSKPIKVDVYQFPAPDANWIVTGQTATKVDADGGKYYTITLIPDAHVETNVTAFQVQMADGAASGSVGFQLRTPCDGCIIKAPSATYVVSGGQFEVHRKSIANYCTDFSDDPECANGGKYYNIINHGISCEGGNLLDNPWITARGVDCQPIPTGDPNSDWSCNVFINPDVHLESLNSSNPFCDITIPNSENNRILSASEDSKDNYLYASATRKMYNLHINISGRTSTSSKVFIAQASSETANSGEPYETCGGDNTECDIPVFAGYKYFLTYEEGGSDKFSNWKCTGLNCPSATHTANSYDIAITTNNSITATFNDVDKHCLYEDFKESDNQNFTAFCGPSSSTRCIDTCSVDPLGKRKMNCPISQSQNWKGLNSPLNPEWVMVYDNSVPECTKRNMFLRCTEYKKSASKQLLAPKITSDGSIYANASSTEDYEDVKFGTQSVILSTKEAGPNGVLTSIFTTKIYSKILGVITSIFGGDDPTFANSGFIFRSNANATEYFSISVYGDGVTGGATGNINVLLCKVKQSPDNPGSTAKPEQCVEQKASANKWLRDPITALTKINMVLTIDGNTVSVDLTLDHNIIGDGERKISFNLEDLYPSSNNFNDDAHSYIGMKLTSTQFKVHDISWQSEKFASDCWDYPKLVCSFKANYLGGVVPQNEDVSPWWSFSSFANDKFSGCTVDFYYNGCDNNSSYSNTFSWDHWSSELQNHLSCRFGADKIGAYWEEGSKLSSSTYNFGVAGPHGFTHSTIYHPLPGKAMDAKVIAVCPKGVDVPSSLSASQSCGDFIVGKINLCEKNYDFLENTLSPIFCNDSCSITEPTEDGFNLRNASVIIKFDNAESKNMRIYLQDKFGKQSTATLTSANGEFTIDVNNVANVDGFDPQTIKSINIKVVDGGFVSVQSALTTCPYALNVKSCSANYTGNAWEISAEVENATACDIEVPSNSNADKSKLSGLCGSTFRLPEEGLLANAGGVYEFAIIATRTTNGGKTVSKRKSCGAATVNATTITCGPLTSENTTKKVGEGTPSLTTTFSNCPNNLCSYEVSLGTEKRTGSVASGTPITHTFTGINTLDNPLAPNQLYNFGVKVILDDAHQVTNSTCGFYVIPESSPENNSSDSGVGETDPKPSSSETSSDEVSFTCPETITIQNGEYIYLNPQDITGCKEGCKYQVSTSAGVDVDHSSYDYENIGGQIGPINGAIIGEVDPKSTEVNQNYSLELTNKLNKKHRCNISVKIQKPCCSCECADKSHIGNTGAPAGKNTEPLCAYGERVLEINENYDKHSIKINGKDVSYCGTEPECRNQLPPKINNGYFIEIPVGGYVVGRVTGGNLATACATSSGGTESTTSITTETSNGEEHLFNIESGSYTLNHNCRNNGGWWYTCTGSSITINGSTYVCGGTQYSTWAQPPSGNQLTYEPPPTGSTLEIPSGTKLDMFGCAQ